MGIMQFLEDYNIGYSTSGKHARPGWVQVECPFCAGNPGYHGGFNVGAAFYNCWRCGWHPMVEVVMALTGMAFAEAKKVIKKYEMLKGDEEEQADNIDLAKVPLSLEMPERNKMLFTPREKAYLSNRDFDPEKIAKTWGVYGAGHLAYCKCGKMHDYRFRIVIPIVYREKCVSFTARAISKNLTEKYLSCPENAEAMHHKHILYGMDHAKGPNAIIVEGPTDVWRLGFGAIATFGIKYTQQQLLLIARTYQSVTILFDPEDEAQLQAHRLCAELLGLGVRAETENLYAINPEASDPADLLQEDANEFMRSRFGPAPPAPLAKDLLQHAKMHDME